MKFCARETCWAELNQCFVYGVVCLFPGMSWSSPETVCKIPNLLVYEASEPNMGWCTFIYLPVLSYPCYNLCEQVPHVWKLLGSVVIHNFWHLL